jgi:hypothetical protein
MTWRTAIGLEVFIVGRAVRAVPALARHGEADARSRRAGPTRLPDCGGRLVSVATFCSKTTFCSGGL